MLGLEVELCLSVDNLAGVDLDHACGDQLRLKQISIDVHHRLLNCH